MSVHRSIAWAMHGDERAARYLGANCGRLLDEVLASEALPEETRDLLARARVLLTGVDQVQGDARLEAIRAVSAALDPVVPLSQLDERLSASAALKPRARLIVPAEGGRPDRPRPVSDEPGAARPVATTAPSAPAASTPPSGTPATSPAPAENPAARVAAPVAAHTPPSAPPAPVPTAAPGTPVAPAPARDTGEARTGEPPDSRMPLGHPAGTGAALNDHVSAAHLEALDAGGIQTFADVLMTAPVRFDRPPLLDATAPDLVGATGVLRGKIRTIATRYSPGGRRFVELTQAVGGDVVVTWRWEDRIPPRGAAWRPGVEIALVGTVTEQDGALVVLEGEPVGMDGRGSGWLPVYNLEGVPDGVVRDLVASALSIAIGALRDPLPEGLLNRHRLLPLDEALRDAHFPANPNARGRHRLAFEELLGISLALSRRLSRGQGERGLTHKAMHSLVGQLATLYEFSLDDEQETAFAEIRRDLLRPTPMTRLLEGEVGTNKGLIALLTAALVAESRSQVAIIAADPLAAERQFIFTEAMLRAVGIKALFVGDQVSHAGADAIRRGEAMVVFGTPRIVAGEVEWRRLGLVIVHEQGTFGTLLPHHLDGKGPRPDLLVVAGAPVPPQLLLTAYGTFEISTITRKSAPSVTTRVFGSAERAGAYEIVREQLAAGRQALVVFPARAGRDVLTRDDASRFSEALRRDLPQGTRVAVYSSDMSREERARTFDDLQHRRIAVLVCTTMIEDGPTVHGCSVLVVEHADHVDLPRLHRLRGHVGRGRLPGYCLLVTSGEGGNDADSGITRLLADPSRLELSDDDLNTPRGPRVDPALIAVEPPQLTWAELPRDRALLLETRHTAFRMLREDNTLRQFGGLRRLIQDRWPELLGEPERPGAALDASKGRRKRRRRRRR